MIQQAVEITETEVEMPRSYKLPTLTCKRCGHKWTPRIQSPAVCPECHSPYWNKPVRSKSSAKSRKKRSGK